MSSVKVLHILYGGKGRFLWAFTSHARKGNQVTGWVIYKRNHLSAFQPSPSGKQTKATVTWITFDLSKRCVHSLLWKPSKTENGGWCEGVSSLGQFKVEKDRSRSRKWLSSMLHMTVGSDRITKLLKLLHQRLINLCSLCISCNDYSKWKWLYYKYLKADTSSADHAQHPEMNSWWLLLHCSPLGIKLLYYLALRWNITTLKHLDQNMISINHKLVAVYCSSINTSPLLFIQVQELS